VSRVDDQPNRALLGLDLGKPSAARIYDYYLGGSQNFEVDRAIARQAMAAQPELPRLMQSNRAFLRRAVRFMAEHGITQFLDIGSGIPTAGNVHEIARAANPAANVVYVDHDAVAVTHSRMILGHDPQTAVVQADLRTPSDILESAEVAALIDFAEPVGLLFFAVLHFVADSDDPAGLVAAIGERAAPGSYLAISHASVHRDKASTDRIAALYRETPTQTSFRLPDRITPLFGRFELIEPGLVEVSQWRPEPGWVTHATGDPAYVGVGRLP